MFSAPSIEFTSARGRKRCPHRLRRIGYRDPDTGKRCVFLTTNFKLSAKTMADIHKSQLNLFERRPLDDLLGNKTQAPPTSPRKPS